MRTDEMGRPLLVWFRDGFAMLRGWQKTGAKPRYRYCNTRVSVDTRDGSQG